MTSQLNRAVWGEERGEGESQKLRDQETKGKKNPWHPKWLGFLAVRKARGSETQPVPGLGFRVEDGMCQLGGPCHR